MDIIIMRHGESDADILNVIEGRANFPLTEDGLKQARAAAEWLKSRFGFDKIYSSPLKRAAQTARAVQQMYDVEITFDDDLMEWQNGLIAGLSRYEAEERYPETVKFPHTSVYGQESLIVFRMRAETVLSKIIHENPNDSTILAVSHGGMISQLFRCFMKLPVDEKVFIHSGDTGIHHLKISEDGTRVIAFINRQEHLLLRKED